MTITPSICYKCGSVVRFDGQIWLDNTDGDGCDPGVHDGAPFAFLHEFLGGREVVNLVSDWDTFALDTIQDYEVADELVQRIRSGEVVITDEDVDHGVYIQRYTLITPEMAAALDGIDYTEHEGTF
jgi:hypothetical protein